MRHPRALEKQQPGTHVGRALRRDAALLPRRAARFINFCFALKRGIYRFASLKKLIML